MRAGLTVTLDDIRADEYYAALLIEEAIESRDKENAEKEAREK